MRGLAHRPRAGLLLLTAVATGILLVAVPGSPANASPGSAPAASVSAAGAHRPSGPSWQLLDTGTQSHFRGLAPVSRQVAWLGGYDGLVLRTVDGGRHWQDVSPAGASTEQFRDISAFDAQHAVALSAGGGTDARIYATSDGGRHWQLAYQNTEPTAFFDCMDFFNPRHGLVLSDPVDGKFRILASTDGGRHWQVLPNASMPTALDGEAGFAASGECLTTSGHDAWFGAGGGSTARVFHSADGGYHWDVRATPLQSSPSAGVFGLAFRNPNAGIAVGGDYAAPTSADRVAALSYLRSPWFSPRTGPAGYRSGVTWLPSTPASAIAVGLTGSDISYDGGLDWHTFDTGQFDTVSCARDGSCWASGDLGRVAVLRR